MSSRKSERFGMRFEQGLLQRIDAARTGHKDAAGHPLSRTGWIERLIYGELEIVEGDAARKAEPALTSSGAAQAMPERSEHVPARPRIRTGINRWMEDR